MTVVEEMSAVDIAEQEAAEGFEEMESVVGHLELVV